MSLEVLQLTGWIDGDHAIDTAGTDHVAGQPARLTANGWVLALNPEDVGGLFKNDMAVDVAGGPQAADAVASGYAKGAVLCGHNKVKMTPGKLKTGAVSAAWVFPGTNTWDVGDRVFVTAAGKWDNAPAALNDPPFGYVTKAPASATDSLEAVIFTGSGLFHSTITT